MKSIIQNSNTPRLRNTLYFLVFFSFVFMSVSCGSTSNRLTNRITADGSVMASNANGGVTGAVAASASAQSASKPVETLEDVPEIVEPPRMVASCKKEPYAKYEKQSRVSIKKGWAATKAGRFGVGFRDAAEYKKWSRTHNTIFKRVSSACSNLSNCTNKYGKQKTKKCAKLATVFRDWQRAVKIFSDKVKSVRATQPPKLCSIPPAGDDPSRCFDELADKIDRACKTEDCKDTSACWRGIAFLDEAIRQATSSCGFVHQKLSNCRSYTQVIARRVTDFKECVGLSKSIKLDLPPVL